MLRPLFVLSSLAVLLHAQGWTDRTAAVGPTARRNHAMCFDAGHGVTMLYGGDNRTDTWTWNSTIWTQLAATGPQGVAMAMAYHAASNQVVMVGAGGFWSWSGFAWTPVGSMSVGGPISEVAMAYDPGRAQTVVFAVVQNGTYPVVTFVWDGSGLSQRATATTPVGGAPSMALDPVSNRLLLATEYNGAAWFYEWNGSNWLQRSYASAPAAPGAMASDGTGVVMFDSVISPTPNHTWTFAGLASAQLGLSVEPARRYGAQMVFDSVRNRFVMFGGTANGYLYTLGDTWEFTRGATAGYSTFGNGCAGSRGVPVIGAQGTSLPRIGTTFHLHVGNLPIQAPVFLFLGFSNTTYGATPLPFSLQPFGAPGCSLLSSGDNLYLLTNVLGTSVWDIPIPNVLGTVFYNQAFAFDPAANTLGVAVSNGGEGTVGM